MTVSLNRWLPLLLLALLAGGIVNSPDGGNHHPRTSADRLRTWAVLSGGSIAICGAFGAFSRLRTKREACSTVPERPARCEASALGSERLNAKAPAHA